MLLYFIILNIRIQDLNKRVEIYLKQENQVLVDEGLSSDLKALTEDGRFFLL